MWHGEDHGIFPPYLYGSRKKKSTHEALITMRCMYDLARIERRYMVSMFNDLKGCYDRVRPNLNTITSRRMGCTKAAAVCHATTVRQMVHKVKTATGLSEGSIMWDPKSNPGGIGQGSGAGPQSYHSHLLIKAAAYETLTDRNLQFKSPDGTDIFTQWLVGFVDDNTILFSIPNKDFSQTLIDKLLTECEKCVGIWQKLVVIPGGELEVKKCSVAVMSWITKNGKEVLASNMEAPGSFHLTSVLDPSISKLIKRLEPQHGERVLGVRLSLDGNDDQEYAFRLKKIQALS